MPKSIGFQSEAEWLAARKKLITASDSRAILGVGFANENALTVYADKVDPTVVVTPPGENESFDVGHILEQPMAELFKLWAAKNLGEEVPLKKDKGYRIRLCDSWPWMGATLDRWYHDGQGNLIPVEMKAVSLYQEWGPEEVPVKVQVQVQHQMCVCNAPYAYVIGFGGIGRVWIKRLERDDDFIRELVLALLMFKKRLDEKSPPDPDWTTATAAALYRLHPDDNGLGVDLPASVLPYVKEYDRLTDLIYTLERRQKQLQNCLKALMGPNTFCALPDKSGFSWKTQERAGYEVQPSKSRVFRRLKKLPKGVSFLSDPARVRIEDFYDRDDSDNGSGGEES